MAWKNLANELGFDFTEEQNESFKGVSRVRSLELLLEIGGRTATQAEKDVWLKKKNEEYLKQGGTFIKIWPEFETISS